MLQLNRSSIATTWVAACVALVVLAALTGVVTASAQVRGVVPEATERFDVATVRQNKEPVPGAVPLGAFVSLPGRFRVTQATLQELITFAYEVYAFEIFGAPSWSTSDRFDINATLEPLAGEPPNAPARPRRMLRALLAERFKLVSHEERREMPVYTLILARPDRKLGARLRPLEAECSEDPSKVSLPAMTGLLPTVAPGQPQLCMSLIGVGRISARGMVLSDLTTMLSRLPAVRRRVLDRTGLTGKFDYDVEWTPTVAPTGVVVPNDRPVETGPSIFVALQEQLGLKLEPGKETLPVVVVDSVSPPTQD